MSYDNFTDEVQLRMWSLDQAIRIFPEVSPNYGLVDIAAAIHGWANEGTVPEK